MTFHFNSTLAAKYLDKVYCRINGNDNRSPIDLMATDHFKDGKLEPVAVSIDT